MADTKITALTAITTVDPANDVLPIVDVSDTSMAASGTTKKITTNQLLGASGTATLASATISGDLTVDTSTLKVDSANNRVGIRTASPAEPLTVDNTSGITTGAIRIYATDQSHSRLAIQNINGQAYHLVAGNPGTSNAGFALYDNTAAATRWYVDNTGVHTFQNVGGVAGTAMTLNSSGLGVGVSPAFKLQVVGTSGSLVDFCGSGVAGLQTLVRLRTATGNTNGLLIQGNVSNDEMYINNFYNAALSFGTNNTERLRIDSSGNVGIGVTPSGTIYSSSETRFVVKGTATSYAGTVAVQSKGTTNAVTGFLTAGDGVNEVAIGSVTNSPINFYTNNAYKASLDASGNLLVGKSSASATTIGFEGRANGTVNSTLASSVDANATYAAYSTGAAAYRFYVGMGGTVYATNTTISAISDARLKENVQDIDVGLGAILALKPRKFDWKDGKGKNIKGDRGFIAQEFETVFPQLVDEWKDEAPEGEAPYKSVRQDLIPVLVKAIQELTARVQTLEAR